MYWDIRTIIKPSNYKTCPAYKLHWGIGGSENVGVANQWLVQLETHAMRGNSPLTLPGRPRGRISQRPRIESNTTGKKCQWNEVIANDILIHSYICAYSNGHQRDFIQQLMETEAKIHRQALGRPQGIPQKRRQNCRSQSSQGEHKKTHRIN